MLSYEWLPTSESIIRLARESTFHLLWKITREIVRIYAWCLTCWILSDTTWQTGLSHARANAWDVQYVLCGLWHLQEVPRLNVAIGPEHSGYWIWKLILSFQTVRDSIYHLSHVGGCRYTHNPGEQVVMVTLTIYHWLIDLYRNPCKTLHNPQ